MSITSHIDYDRKIVVHYDTEATEPATRFVIWFEGREATVVATAGELPAATWDRVCAEARFMRRLVAEEERSDPNWKEPAFLLRGSTFSICYVYAGIEPTQQNIDAHIKEWITWTLYRIAFPRWDTKDARNARNAKERIAALSALADMYCQRPPQQPHFIIPSLDEIRAEIARRS